MGRPAIPFEEMTRNQKVRKCQYLRSIGKVGLANELQKQIPPATKTLATKTLATKTLATKTLATKTPATKTLATKTPATKTLATKTPATKTLATKTLATKTPATKTPATKTPATKTPATKTPATKTPAIRTSLHLVSTKTDDTKTDSVRGGNRVESEEMINYDSIQKPYYQSPKNEESIFAHISEEGAKLIDLKTKKKFIIEENGNIKEAPHVWSVIKVHLMEKWLYTLNSALKIEYGKIILASCRLLPLIAMALAYSIGLVIQGQDSYELMGLPYHEVLAVGVVMTLAVLKFWSAMSKSFLLKLLLIGVLGFEGFVLYSGTEINSDTTKTKTQARKEFLVADIERLEGNIETTKKDIVSYDETTSDKIKILTDRIEKKKVQNVWNFKKDPAIVGVLDLQNNLNKYREERRIGLSALRKEQNFDVNEKLLVSHKTELAGISTVKNDYSEIAVKSLIGLVMLLNLYVFHCLGSKFRRIDDRKTPFQRIKEYISNCLASKKECKA